MRGVVRVGVALAALVLGLLPLSGTDAARADTLDANGRPISNAEGTRFGVQAHRGGGDEWPQNSVEALAHAAASGFDAIETDILFTRDGVPVINHSDRLSSRCTQAGRRIHRMSFAEVRRVRCEDLNGRRVVPLATFDQLTTLLRSYPDVWLSLDLKSYPGQSDAGRRAYARRAMELVDAAGLLPRTRVISFLWEQHLPVVHAYSPSTFFYAYDIHHMDLDRVRLAARLGADAYGIKLKYTTHSLTEYVRSLGMESAPYDVYTPTDMAFAVATGGPYQLFSTNSPTRVQADLVSGRVPTDPSGTDETTTLDRPVVVSSATYRAGRPRYPLVLGTALPDADLPALRTVTVELRVTGGVGRGTVTVAASDYPAASAVRTALPRGSDVVRVDVPVGEGGRLRISTTRTVRLTVRITGYTNVRYR